MDAQADQSTPKWILPYQPTSYELLRLKKLPSSSHIRLLQKREYDDPRIFDCSIHVFPLEEVPPYTALSYTWGPPLLEHGAPETYKFHIICDDRVFPVTENLFMAMRRFSTAGGYIWIDQICINQQDKEEKALQVARMGAIYANAAGVYIWLGEQDKDAETTYGIMRSFGPAYVTARQRGVVVAGPIRYNDKEFWRNIGLEPWTNEQTSAIIRFFNRAWFERAWTIQELVLANEAAVACGGLAVNWVYVALLSWFLDNSGWHNAFQKAKNLSLAPIKSITTSSGEVLEQTQDSMQVGAVPIVYTRLRDFVVGEYSRGLAPKVGIKEETELKQRKHVFYNLLESLLLFFRSSKTSEPADKVFAPLSMAAQLLLDEESRPSFLFPDYTLAASEVYTQVVGLIIEETESLSVISQAESSSTKIVQHLPSWVPDFSSFTLSALRLAYRSNNFPFSPVYNAMAGCPIPLCVSPSGKTLSVKAILWDEIVDRLPSDPVTFFNLHPLLWIKFCLKLENPYVNGQTRDEVLWRTMICDQGPHHEYPARSDVGIKFHDFALTMITGSSDIEEQAQKIHEGIMEEFSIPELDILAADSTAGFLPTSKEVTELARRLWKDDSTLETDSKWALNTDIFAKLDQNARADRVLFRSSKNCLGHGPRMLEHNDYVAFLVGSTVPFVLRSVGHGRYKLIGETYVHGYMSGEVLKEEHIQFHNIELV